MIAKDYELIAETLRELRSENAALPRAGEIVNQTLDRAAGALAARLEADNPRFRRDLFMAACGVEG